MRINIRKTPLLFLFIILILITSSCSNNKVTTLPDTPTTPSFTTCSSTDSNPTTIEPKEEAPYANKAIELKIGNTIVDVNWLDNDSVKALKELAKDGLTINMSMYGNFEQVGSLGKCIASSDASLTTSPGDIVLYSSNQIVLFYDSNTWSYTKLGHINLSKSELIDLLGDEDVVITMDLK